jgi:hypothetical protein
VINFKTVQLEDKPVIDTYFRMKRYQASECTFTNLYLWRDSYNVRWAVVNDMLCVTMSWGGNTFFLPPFGKDENIGKSMEAMVEYSQSTNLDFLLKGATEETVHVIERALPGRFDFQRDRDNDDYVHLTSELKELKGRKFSSKTNHIHFFKNHYPDYRFVPLTREITKDCIGTAYQWYVKHMGQDELLRWEFAAVKDALEHFEELGLRGGALLIYGKVEAFSLGEPLNEDMCVIHIEKGNSDIRGIYQVINQECCLHCWPEFTFVNREEDMGIPGLRKAKLSYRPVKMIEKYDVTLKAGR